MGIQATIANGALEDSYLAAQGWSTDGGFDDASPTVSVRWSEVTRPTHHAPFWDRA